MNNQCDGTANPDPRFKGDPCDADAQCVEEGVFCSPVDRTCGGEQAHCERDFSSPSEIGESDDCVSSKCEPGVSACLVCSLIWFCDNGPMQGRQQMLIDHEIPPRRRLRQLVRLP